MQLQVKELAGRCGVSADTVRHYTRIGLLSPRRDPGNGYKLFDEGDARRLNFIHRAKQLGYTLAEIRKIIAESRRGRSPCPMVREILEGRIRENRKRLEEALHLQRRMEQALANWKKLPDGMPDGHSICRLIESFHDADQGR